MYDTCTSHRDPVLLHTLWVMVGTLPIYLYLVQTVMDNGKHCCRATSCSGRTKRRWKVKVTCTTASNTVTLVCCSRLVWNENGVETSLFVSCGFRPSQVLYAKESEFRRMRRVAQLSISSTYFRIKSCILLFDIFPLLSIPFQPFSKATCDNSCSDVRYKQGIKPQNCWYFVVIFIIWWLLSGCEIKSLFSSWKHERFFGLVYCGFLFFIITYYAFLSFFFFFGDRQPCRSDLQSSWCNKTGRPVGLPPSPTAWSPDQYPAAMLADVSWHILGRTEGCGVGFGQLVLTHTVKRLKCQSSSDGHSDHNALCTGGR